MIEADQVVLFHYRLSDADGRLLEDSHGGEPAAYLHGHGNIIPGLEAAMAGHAAGDSFAVTVPPEQAYGLRREDARQRIPAKHLRGIGKGRPRPGTVAWVETEHGERQVTVIKAGQFMVEVDGNHPLAGKTLSFAVEVVEVRPASPEELAHGHVHGPGGQAH